MCIDILNLHLLVDLNSFIIILKLRGVLRDFQKTLVRGGVTFLATEVVRSLFVMMYRTLQVHGIAFVDLGYTLMMFSCHRKTAHVGINLDSFQQTADRLCDGKARICYIHFDIV